jgi:DNA-binding LytR/AlgR family response regulator
MPLRVVIADDEVLARQKLLQLLRDEPDVEVVGEGANALETIDLVQFTQPDVLLLDVRMPGMDGFDVISALSSSSLPLACPSIIFTTAHDQYALKAFEVHAVDYLLKPFTRERLQIALQHAREQREHGRPQRRQIHAKEGIYESPGLSLQGANPLSADCRHTLDRRGRELCENLRRQREPYAAQYHGQFRDQVGPRGFPAGASLGDRKSAARERNFAPTEAMENALS